MKEGVTILAKTTADSSRDENRFKVHQQQHDQLIMSKFDWFNWKGERQ